MLSKTPFSPEPEASDVTLDLRPLRALRSAALRPPELGLLDPPPLEKALRSMVARRLRPAAFFRREVILFGLDWGTLGASTMTAASFSSESNSCGDGVRVNRLLVQTEGFVFLTGGEARIVFA